MMHSRTHPKGGMLAWMLLAAISPERIDNLAYGTECEPRGVCLSEVVDPKTLFSIVIEEKRDVLVLFSGKWCPDCRRFEPVWDKWIAGKDDRIYIVEVARDGDEWDEWRIDEIPTVVAYAKGKKLDRAHGRITAAELDRLWNELAPR